MQFDRENRKLFGFHIAPGCQCAIDREVKKGVAPKNAPTYIDKSKLKEKVSEQKWANYKCAACGYVYESDKEGMAFDDLPDDWICPVCGSEKEDFIKVE